MTGGPTPQPRPFLFRARRWAWRGLLAVALANLAWDLADWHDRRGATGERLFYRGAERPEDLDGGVVELTLANDTVRDWVVNIVNVDGWGGPRYAGPVQPGEILSRQGTDSATRTERRYLDRLLSQGIVILTDLHSGEMRQLPFTVDRRRPINCRVALRVREDGLLASDCAPLRERPVLRRWVGAADHS